MRLTQYLVQGKHVFVEWMNKLIDEWQKWDKISTISKKKMLFKKIILARQSILPKKESHIMDELSSELRLSNFKALYL